MGNRSYLAILDDSGEKPRLVACYSGNNFLPPLWFALIPWPAGARRVALDDEVAEDELPRTPDGMLLPQTQATAAEARARAERLAAVLDSLGAPEAARAALAELREALDQPGVDAVRIDAQEYCGFGREACVEVFSLAAWWETLLLRLEAGQVTEAEKPALRARFLGNDAGDPGAYLGYWATTDFGDQLVTSWMPRRVQAERARELVRLADFVEDLLERRPDSNAREQMAQALAEAVALYRPLAEAQPDVFRPALADALARLVALTPDPDPMLAAESATLAARLAEPACLAPVEALHLGRLLENRGVTDLEHWALRGDSKARTEARARFQAAGECWQAFAAKGAIKRPDGTLALDPTAETLWREVFGDEPIEPGASLALRVGLCARLATGVDSDLTLARALLAGAPEPGSWRTRIVRVTVEAFLAGEGDPDGATRIASLRAAQQAEEEAYLLAPPQGRTTCAAAWELIALYNLAQIAALTCEGVAGRTEVGRTTQDRLRTHAVGIRRVCSGENLGPTERLARLVWLGCCDRLDRAAGDPAEPDGLGGQATSAAE